MNTSTARTSITIKSTLLERLRLFANQHNRTVSEVVEQGVSLVMRQTKAANTEDMYKELFKLKGVVGKSDPKYKDKSVDEILYGEDGVWRGSDR